MALCELHFSNWESLELFRVTFCPIGSTETIIAVRGKTPRGFKATTNFQWTSAVRALAGLLVKRSLIGRQNSPSISCAYLEGSGGSLASSLDYALGRCPTWLAEMFGTNDQGRPLSRKLFLRGNPDGRRPGPVSVSLNEQIWKDLPIRILVNSNEVTDCTELEKLVKLLGGSYEKPQAISDTSQIPQIDSEYREPDAYAVIRDVLREPFDAALLHGLCAVDVLHPAGLKRHLNKIAKFKSFVHVAGKRAADLASISLPHDAASRLAFGEVLTSSLAFLRDREPLKVLAPVSLIGSVVMFHYLRDHCNIPIKIECDYPHAVFVASSFVKGDLLGAPDLVSMGVGPSAYVLGGERTGAYAPLFPLPCMSAKVFTSAKNSDLTHKKSHRYTLLSDEPSNPLFLYEDLREAGLTKEPPLHTETDETFDCLESDPALRAIIFFPYDVLNIKFNNCREVPMPKGLYQPDLLLFGKQEIAADERLCFALGVVLRHAWLELIANQAIRRLIVENLLNDPQYLRTIFRASGLYRNVHGFSLNRTPHQSRIIQ